MLVKEYLENCILSASMFSLLSKVGTYYTFKGKYNLLEISFAIKFSSTNHNYASILSGLKVDTYQAHKNSGSPHVEYGARFHVSSIVEIQTKKKCKNCDES